MSIKLFCVDKAVSEMTLSWPLAARSISDVTVPNRGWLLPRLLVSRLVWLPGLPPTVLPRKLFDSSVMVVIVSRADDEPEAWVERTS